MGKLNLAYPLAIWGFVKYTRDKWKQGLTPEISYLIAGHILAISLVGHKERRFGFPTFSLMFLLGGYLLAERAKSWPKTVKLFLWINLINEAVKRAQETLSRESSPQEVMQYLNR